MLWHGSMQIGGNIGMTDACKLEDLSGQIIEHSGKVNGSLGAPEEVDW